MDSRVVSDLAIWRLGLVSSSDVKVREGVLGIFGLVEMVLQVFGQIYLLDVCLEEGWLGVSRNHLSWSILSRKFCVAVLKRFR